jgi:fructuronate reductase
VTGVSLRGTSVADSLTPQDDRYTLITRGNGVSGQVIGALAGVLAGPNVGMRALDAIIAPGCRIVSLTVTEKGYGITSAGVLDRSHPAVKADLAQPAAPTGVIGLIVAALAARRDAGLRPFTVLSCDNLSHNGQKLRAAVLEFTNEAYGVDLADWIGTEARFPATMVDRITPAPSAATAETALLLTQYRDEAAVETEPFTQWVIEDDFCAGRPAWEQAGVLFVDDVAPYERMKLRMLNGAHSMLAYSGQLAGRPYVRDVMADPAHAALVRAHLAAAAATVTGLSLDLEAYAEALAHRFSNPAIAHATAQIAIDGTQKLPQRITATALDALAAGTPVRLFAFTLAAWLAWLAQRDATGQTIVVDDPKAALLATAVSAQATPAGLIEVISNLCPDILPKELTGGHFGATLHELLAEILLDGITAVIGREIAIQNG